MGVYGRRLRYTQVPIVTPAPTQRNATQRKSLCVMRISSSSSWRLMAFTASQKFEMPPTTNWWLRVRWGVQCHPQGPQTSERRCLSSGSCTKTIFDSYGDGIRSIVLYSSGSSTIICNDVDVEAGSVGSLGISSESADFSEICLTSKILELMEFNLICYVRIQSVSVL
jgi:hypothetical protein